MCENKNVDTQKLFALWATTMTADEIQKELGISHNKLYSLARHHKLPHRHIPKKSKSRIRSRESDPTEEEIAQRAAEIRANWSDQEYERRAGKKSSQWQAPAYTYAATTNTFEKHT